MLTNISDEILGLKFKYFANDCMALSSVGCKKNGSRILQNLHVYTMIYITLKI